MNLCILMGSPRKDGNTAALLAPFIEEMETLGHVCTRIDLYDKELHPCIACRSCQKDHRIFGCIYHDDMQELFDRILSCDLLVLATPIYCWFCTAPMKAVLDRLMYGMNKYYGEERGPALWAGKPVALITTCGYPPAKGSDLWEEGMRRYCRHSSLTFLGELTERHLGYQTIFMDEEKASHARAFARQLCEKLEVQ